MCEAIATGLRSFVRTASDSAPRNLPDSDLAEIEIRLSDPTLTSHLRARLLFALAHVLDSRGDYRRVPEVLRKANALTLDQAVGYRVYEEERHSEYAEKIIARIFVRELGNYQEELTPRFRFLCLVCRDPERH